MQLKQIKLESPGNIKTVTRWSRGITIRPSSNTLQYNFVTHISINFILLSHMTLVVNISLYCYLNYNVIILTMNTLRSKNILLKITKLG